MGATTPYLETNRELACAGCGRTLLLGERYEPLADGAALCEFCRHDEHSPPEEQPLEPTPAERLRHAWRALLRGSEHETTLHGRRAS
jgi:hypothetical protein